MNGALLGIESRTLVVLLSLRYANQIGIYVIAGFCKKAFNDNIRHHYKTDIITHHIPCKTETIFGNIEI